MMAITVLQRHKGREALSVAMLSRHNAPTQVGDRREWVSGTTPASLKQANAGGFSLIEVLFAVLILTMGMIFVAMQFPVGLANSRKITNETLKVITTHNAKIMMELQLGAMVKSGVALVIQPVASVDSLLINDGNVHLLPKVNLLNDLTMVVDDPEDMLMLNSPQDYDQTGFNLNTPPDFFPPYMTIDDSDNLKLGNLGQIMSPQVTSSDVAVVDIVGTDYDPMGDDPLNYPDMNDAIFDVSLTRQYSWCALYKFIGQNNIRFYIFTLRKGTRAYAMQDQTKLPLLDTLGVNEDRMFPVPWLIELNAPLDTSLFSAGDPIDRFDIFDYTTNVDTANTILNMLQEGTKIVDARFGHIYEVMEINLNNANWNIRLTTDLHELNGEYLEHFWVVPPAIEDSSSLPLIFGEVDPVVDVAEQVIRF